ncbi:MAG: hypothetical protein ACI4XM_06060 [Candidatus Coprovivens sp.]
MKDNVIENKRIINYIFTIIASLGLIIGVGIIIYDYMLEQKAININARITSLDYQNGSYKATVKYKVDKESYNQVISISDDSYTVNDEIAIKYDINNPGKLIKNNHYFIYLPLIGISIIILLVSIKKTITNIKRSNNIKRLLKKGIYINATISEIIIDNKSGKNKGQYPYKLRAKYNNPLDNQVYTFDSEPTYIDLNSVIKEYNNKLVLVYLDLNNTSNYYVDLNSLFPHAKLVDVGELMGEKKKEQPKQSDDEGKNKQTDEDKSQADTKEDQEKE